MLIKFVEILGKLAIKPTLTIALQKLTKTLDVFRFVWECSHMKLVI